MGEYLRAFVRWWGAELRDLIPAPVRALWTGIPAPLHLHFDPERTSPEQHGREIHIPCPAPFRAEALDAAADLLAVRSGRAVEAHLPVSACLERQVALPGRARWNARQILELDLARATPLDRNQVLWQYHLERGPNGASAHQYVVKTSDIEALDTALARYGLMLGRVWIAARQGAGLSPLVDRQRAIARPWRWWRRIEFAAVLVALLALAYMVGAPHLARQAELAALKPRIDALATEAQALRKELSAREAAAETAAGFARALAEHPKLGAQLHDLTQALSDETWLQSVDTTPQGLRIAGLTSRDAAQLIERLATVPTLGDPQLEGSVALDARSGGQRFQISTRLKGTP